MPTAPGGNWQEVGLGRHILAAIIATLVLATAAAASVAVVPDQFATIQGAIDSGADSVLVADGDYHERLQIASRLVLLPKPRSLPSDPPPFPRVGGAVIDITSGSVLVREIRFTGLLSMTHGSHEYRLEACRLDSGLIANDVENLYVRGCLIFGTADVLNTFLDFVGNAIIGGGILGLGYGRHTIRDNYVAGPAPAGIACSASSDQATIANNVVTASENGIVLSSPGGTIVSDNEVRSCSGTGISVDGGSERRVTLLRNHVGECGGDGIALVNSDARCDSNTITDIGGCGIRVSQGAGGSSYLESVVGNRVERTGSHGMWLDAYTSRLDANTVLRAGGDGIRVMESQANGNVIGHSKGSGFVVEVQVERFSSNTVYSNGGAGFVLNGDYRDLGDSLDHNIAYGNHGAGLNWLGGGTLGLSCNDWYENFGGPTTGTPPGADDLLLDPRFCDLASDSVTLSAGSPLLNAAGCGRIGALGLGCLATTAVEPPVARKKVELRAVSNPAPGALRFEAVGINGPARLEVFDAGGARRWSADFGPGAVAVRWDGTDSGGRRVAPGVYFARLVGIGGGATARVVLLR